MNDKDYFEKIICNCSSNEEKIIKILEARGFFMDNKDGIYYMSDNATYNDMTYLAYGLEKYKLGKVFKCEPRWIHTRKGNDYAIIEPYKSIIVIDKDAQIKEAVKFFEETGKVSFPVCSWGRSWSEFVYRSYGRKCDVKDLEPYVSYYVKSLSACGVDTDYSCDGNHPNGRKVIVGSCYPYCLWQAFIQKQFLIVFEPNIEKLDFGLGYTKENQFVVYYGLYCAADYLYKNRLFFRNLKAEACSSIDRKTIRKNNNKMLEDIFINNLNKLLE